MWVCCDIIMNSKTYYQVSFFKGLQFIGCLGVFDTKERAISIGEHYAKEFMYSFYVGECRECNN